MPVTTVRDDDKRLFVVTASGGVEFQELLAVLKETRGGDCSDYALLFDANAVTRLPGADFARDFVARVRTISETTPRGRVALVSSSNAIYGALRVYETFYELAGVGGTRVFRDMAEALRWLGEEPRPTETP